MKLDLLATDRKYLLGVSGGSDSMMLLSLCLKQNLSIVVAHVNYNLREHAAKEEELVVQYCQQHEIPCMVYHCDPQFDGNMENWAREVRYDFYKTVYDMYHCDCLLLGHQLDDHIETYLMMLERGSVGWCYGIAQSNHHHGMDIYRPLLSIRKKETQQYCLENNVPYACDESNDNLDYTRNRIRHQVIAKASDEQIQQWVQQINQLNSEIQQRLTYISENYDLQEIELQSYRKEDRQTRQAIIRLLYQQVQQQTLSQSFVEEIDRLLLINNNNGKLEINPTYSLFWEYGVCYVDRNNDDFYYGYDQLTYTKTKHFQLKQQGESIEGLTVNPQDFPIVVRNAYPHDEIEMRFGHKKINRFFIDRKIKHKKRIRTVVIENCQHQIIFVEGLGCDVSHYTIKHNLFVVK